MMIYGHENYRVRLYRIDNDDLGARRLQNTVIITWSLTTEPYIRYLQSFNLAQQDDTVNQLSSWRWLAHGCGWDFSWRVLWSIFFMTTIWITSAPLRFSTHRELHNEKGCFCSHYSNERAPSRSPTHRELQKRKG